MINIAEKNFPAKRNGILQYGKASRCLLKSLVIMMITFVVIINSGCRSLGLSPAAMLDDYFEQIMVSISSQEDAELVRQGVPTLILFLDASLAGNPEEPKLLLTTATAYTTYAQAFLNSEDDMKRAAILYGRAREYGFRLLRQRKFFAGALTGSLADFEKALMQCKKADVPDLYVTGNAWLGWILSQPDSMEALDELPKVIAIMQRVLVLDNEYADGGVHVMFGIYYSVRPPGAGRDLNKSRKHFRRAMMLAGESNLFPRVAFAEFYLTVAGDEKKFEEILNGVSGSRNDGKNRDKALINAIARERAGKLLKKSEDYF
jgi:TRAP transporter TatT component family protein